MRYAWNRLEGGLVGGVGGGCSRASVDGSWFGWLMYLSLVEIKSDEVMGGFGELSMFINVRSLRVRALRRLYVYNTYVANIELKIFSYCIYIRK